MGGAKRLFSDVDGSASQQNDAFKKRRQQQSKSQSHYKPSNDSGPSKTTQSLNEVKRRARNIERRFAKGGLPADVQQRLERELVQCRRQIGDLQHKKKRAEMISKYHQVRFFERQKAERLRKKLKKQLDEAAGPEERARIQADYHIADVDVHYTRYFPFLERYEGLYAAEKSRGEEDPDLDGQTIAERALHSARPPMWKVVEEALGRGQAALGALQERRTGATDTTTEEVAPGEKTATQGRPDRSRGRHGRTGTGTGTGTELEKKQVPGRGGDDAAADSDGSGFFG